MKNKDIQEVLELSRSGWSQRKIAAKMGVSKFCVPYYLLSPEKREEMRIKQAAYKKDHPRHKALRNKESMQTYKARKEALGVVALRQNALSKIDRLSGEEKLDSWFFYKRKLENLLEVEPLLILFRDKNDKIKVTT